MDVEPSSSDEEDDIHSNNTINQSSVAQEAIARCQVELTRQNVGIMSDKLSMVQEITQDRQFCVNELERELEEAKRRLARSKSREQVHETHIEQLKHIQQEAEKRVAEHAAHETVEALDIVQLDQKVCTKKLTPQEAKCLETIQNIRGYMAAGQVKQARTAEATLHAWMNMEHKRDEPNCVPNFTHLGAPGAIVPAATFVPPYSLVSEQELESTLEYAKNHPTKVFRYLDMDSIRLWSGGMMGYAHKYRHEMPPHVNLDVMNEIRAYAAILHDFLETENDGIPEEEGYSDDNESEQSELEQMDYDNGEENGDEEEEENEPMMGVNRAYFRGIVQDMIAPLQQRIENDPDNRHQDENENENEQQPSKRLQDAMWAAIEPCVRKHQEIKRKYNQLQLELPNDKSAAIARFNTQAHFRFSSAAAQQSTPPLIQALVNCELRRGPAYSIDQRAMVQVRRPFLYDTHANSYSLDERFSMDQDGDLIAVCEGGAVSCANVPSHTNLDVDVGDDEGDSLDWRLLYKQTQASFSECLIDSSRDVVWASQADGSILGLSTMAPETKDETRQVAELTFRKHEELAIRHGVGGLPVGISRLENYIVASGSTSALSLWNIDKAMDDYAKNSTGNIAKSLPRLVEIEDKASGFMCGDVQGIDGSNVLIGSSRWGFEDASSISVRLFDLEREKVAGLFCGFMGSPSIEKQHCVERFNSIFLADDHASYVYDVRTYQPCITLETKVQGQILGVPCEVSMMAFTFCHRDKEEIQCWDLRMPTSHAYTMWTGDRNVDSLFWHAPTTSLFAATSFPPGRIPFRDEMPQQTAVHDPDYFGDWGGNRKMSFPSDTGSIYQYSFAC